MSFCANVKNELCNRKPDRNCCVLAECCGALMYASVFNSDAIRISIEHELAAEHILSLLRRAFKVFAEITRTKSGVMSKIKISDKNDISAIMNKFPSVDTIPEKIVYNDCCKAAFLRGVFLSSAVIADPNKGYHLEFLCPNHASAKQLFTFLVSCGFAAKIAVRDSTYSVYFKDSGSIEDILTFMGATASSLELMEVKIYKDVRNKVNRVTNFETANYMKTYGAGSTQLDAIEKLERLEILPTLSGELQLAARLRMENPDGSLKELADDGGISKSGLNHRLQKLVEIASGYKE